MTGERPDWDRDGPHKEEERKTKQIRKEDLS